PALLHALNYERIGLRDEIPEKRRSLRSGNPFGRRQIFYRLGKSMQPAKIFSPRKLRISLIRLLKQRIPILERDDRVNPRIDTVDVSKKPLHYRSTGNLLCRDRTGQSHGIHCEQLGDISGWHISSWSKAIHSGPAAMAPVINPR